MVYTCIGIGGPGGLEIGLPSKQRRPQDAQERSINLGESSALERDKSRNELGLLVGEHLGHND